MYYGENEKEIKGYRLASINDVKKIQIDILSDVVNFCKQNSINMYIAYGSLIGTIRHHGFIPWDDDIDIWMLRSDYNKFINIYNERESCYKVCAIENDNMYPYPYAKISFSDSIQYEKIEGEDYNIRINIDLFPLDNLPNDEKKQKKIIKKLKSLELIQTLKTINLDKKRTFYKTAILSIANVMFNFISLPKICKKINLIASSYNDLSSNFVGTIVCIEGLKEKFEKNSFDDITYKKFETVYVPVPNRYDEILKGIYGDYMELPPVEKRVTHHMYQAYIKIN